VPVFSHIGIGVGSEHMADNNDHEAIIDLEERRIAAVNAADVDTIARMLADDFIQVHANGRVDDKASLLEIERSTRRTIAPRNPTVRLYGNVAVLMGPALHRAMLNGAEVTYHIFTTQVAVKRNDTWQFVAVQATMLPS
jgi:ketosteroid isomerase-like protein